MNDLTLIRFGGFLGRRPSSRRSLSTGYPGCAKAPGGSLRRVLPLVSQRLHPARKDIDRADHIGVVLEPALDADEFRLRPAVVRAHATAIRTLPTGVVRG